MKKTTERQTKTEPPIAPALKAREAIEFLVTLANLHPEALNVGRPDNIGDCGYASGVFYELCRFTQATRSYYEKWVDSFVKDPTQLHRPADQIRELLLKIVDEGVFEFTGFDPETAIRVYGVQFHRAPFRSPLPFIIASPTIIQALVVTACFYLGLNRDSALIRRCSREQCRKFFFAVRKTKRFCSHECASAVSVGRFRSRVRAAFAASSQLPRPPSKVMPTEVE